MKKFFKGIKDLILRHKLLTIICILALIVGIILINVFFSMFVGGTGKYGDRLKGIEEVTISSKAKKEVVTFLEEKDTVVDASVRVQGKIVYINIIFTRDTSLDRAKAVATETLALFEDEEKEYYDFGYFLTQEEVSDTEDKGFIITGSKNAKLESITWIKS